MKNNEKIVENKQDLYDLYNELIRQRQIVECKIPTDVYEMNERLGLLLFALTSYIEETYPNLKKDKKIW